jgi:hypothetical protein
MRTSASNSDRGRKMSLTICLPSNNRSWRDEVASPRPKHNSRVIGICSAVFIYVTASPPPQHPLGYDPFASKKYLRDLELYGGKINILAVEFYQWLDRLWRGQNLSYTIACITVILAYIFWFIGSHSTSHLDTHAEKHHAP